MSCLRLYAAPLMLLVWAALVLTLSSSVELIALRLASLAVALTVSIHESGHRRRRD